MIDRNIILIIGIFIFSLFCLFFFLVNMRFSIYRLRIIYIVDSMIKFFVLVRLLNVVNILLKFMGFGVMKKLFLNVDR